MLSQDELVFDEKIVSGCMSQRYAYASVSVFDGLSAGGEEPHFVMLGQQVDCRVCVVQSGSRKVVARHFQVRDQTCHEVGFTVIRSAREQGELVSTQ